tara:strand:- start:947 stop:1648 length:702 start_codon:yes stop_codon:yes gene_type:complete
MDLKKQIKIALGLETEEEVKLGFQAKTEDGTIIVSESDTLEVGVDISVLTEDGTTIPLPVGLYVMEDGTKVKVEEEGKVAEIMEGEAEETEEEVEQVEASEEEELKHKPNHKYEEIEERMTKLEKAVEELVKEYGKDKEEMSEETTEEEEVVEPRGDSPKTVTTKTTEVVEFSAEDEIKKLKEENEKLKTELAESPADAPVNTNKFSANRPVLTTKQYNRLSKQEKFLYNLNR